MYHVFNHLLGGKVWISLLSVLDDTTVCFEKVNVQLSLRVLLMHTLVVVFRIDLLPKLFAAS